MATPVSIETDPWGHALAWLRLVLESALDWIFSLKHSAGLYRNIVRSMGFLLFYIYSVAVLYDYNQWQELFSNLFPATIASNPNLLIINLGVLAFSTVLHPEVLRHLLALAAPYMLIHRLAAVYMADIFEKDANVARRFINQAAFAEDYLTIRVRAGTLVESNHDSPIVQIGGPGYVTVELDSAAVFESHDGTVRVIGPTSKMPHGRAVVEDFERLRQCIDLRDIIDRQEVTSRSRDGILVKARDIQYSYSVYRGENLQKTLNLPYPFEEEAIKRMVKAVIVPVSPGKQADTRPEWMRPLPGKLFVSINIEFSNFIGRNGLSEFFSSIGSPEEDALRQQGEQLGKDAQALAGNEGQSSNDVLLKAGSFKHRPKLAEDMFKSHTFINFMKAKGLQVNWIGVGTWQTPSQIIPENHLDAWKTSQENKRLGSPEQLNRLYRETHANTVIQLVNQLPLSPYYRLYSEMEQGQKTETQVIEVLLEQYLTYLRNISKHFEDHQQSPPENIITALEAVGLLQYHQVGSDYYACIKTTSRPDIDIQGAMTYTIEVAFSSYPLPGYTPHAVMFDFGDRQQLDFAFSVNVPNLTVEPSSPQTLNMQRDELYVRAQFQVSIFPDTSTDAQIDIEQNGSNIAHLLVTLTN
jgi:hypothetical protein